MMCSSTKTILQTLSNISVSSVCIFLSIELKATVMDNCREKMKKFARQLEQGSCIGCLLLSYGRKTGEQIKEID
jgi:hypothetical protein